jgi:hypothetical protein
MTDKLTRALQKIAESGADYWDVCIARAALGIATLEESAVAGGDAEMRAADALGAISTISASSLKTREDIEILRQWQLAHCSNKVQILQVNALCDMALASLEPRGASALTIEEYRTSECEDYGLRIHGTCNPPDEVWVAGVRYTPEPRGVEDAKVAALMRRLHESRQRVSAMCAEGRGPRMTVPADPERDDDLFICCTVEDAADLIERLHRERAQSDAVIAHDWPDLAESLNIPPQTGGTKYMDARANALKRHAALIKEAARG